MSSGERAGEVLGIEERSGARQAALDSLKAAHEYAATVGDRREADLEWIYEEACRSFLPDEDILAVCQDVSRGRILRAISRLA